MTAAPGPQQPDEVVVALVEEALTGYGSLLGAELTSAAESVVDELRDAGWLTRPAAPSAQPDQTDCRKETVEEQAERYGLPVELLRAPVTFTAPAQPVRDIGEGRR